MITRAYNLVLAIVVALLLFPDMIPDLVHPEVVLLASLVLVVWTCWVAGAIGLFFRKKWAWWGSFIGACGAAFLFLGIVSMGGALFLPFPLILIGCLYFYRKKLLAISVTPTEAPSN